MFRQSPRILLRFCEFVYRRHNNLHTLDRNCYMLRRDVTSLVRHVHNCDTQLKPFGHTVCRDLSGRISTHLSPKSNLLCTKCTSWLSSRTILDMSKTRVWTQNPTMSHTWTTLCTCQNVKSMHFKPKQVKTCPNCDTLLWQVPTKLCRDTSTTHVQDTCFAKCLHRSGTWLVGLLVQIHIRSMLVRPVPTKWTHFWYEARPTSCTLATWYTCACAIFEV